MVALGVVALPFLAYLASTLIHPRVLLFLSIYIVFRAIRFYVAWKRVQRNPRTKLCIGIWQSSKYSSFRGTCEGRYDPSTCTIAGTINIIKGSDGAFPWWSWSQRLRIPFVGRIPLTNFAGGGDHLTPPPASSSIVVTGPSGRSTAYSSFTQRYLYGLLQLSFTPVVPGFTFALRGEYKVALIDLGSFILNV